MNYKNFDLRIERNGEIFLVSVISSPAGSGEAELIPPYSDEELQRTLGSLAESDRDVGAAAYPRETTVKQLGTSLFEALFRDRVGILWMSSRERVDAAHEGLRLRLSFKGAARFESWPWELLFDPFRGQFLAQSEWTPVVRCLERFNPALFPAEPPLRMLVAIAEPSGYPALDADREWERIRQALRSWVDQGWLVLDRLKRATLGELRRNLREPCHILHIVSHGRFHSERGHGALALEDETGRGRVVSGDKLGAVLAAQRELRLVVLNACEGALTLRDDPFTGVAQALVDCRIPAVIAMRSRISDSAAVAFAEHFYDALGRNRPVDVALAEARHGMFSGRDDLEWTAPVLYTRSSDCRPFHFPPPSEPQPSPEPVSPGESFLGRIPRPAWVAAAVLSMVGALAGAFYPFMKAAPRTAPKAEPADPNLAYVAQNPPECPSPLALPMAFVKVLPGSFFTSDKPRREIKIMQPFCIGRFEVTQTQWKEIMGNNPSEHKGDSLPVEKVSWVEVQEFLTRLNARVPGANFRLPINAQWEYAADAGTAGPSSFKGNPEDLSRYGNCGNHGSTIPVGSLAPNPWGIFDMYGNVAEWVADAPSSPAGASPEMHVRRGGGFRNKPGACDSVTPSLIQGSRHNSDTGFRIIRDLVKK